MSGTNKKYFIPKPIDIPEINTVLQSTPLAPNLFLEAYHRAIGTWADRVQQELSVPPKFASVNEAEYIWPSKESLMIGLYTTSDLEEVMNTPISRGRKFPPSPIACSNVCRVMEYTQSKIDLVRLKGMSHSAYSFTHPEASLFRIECIILPGKILDAKHGIIDFARIVFNTDVSTVRALYPRILDDNFELDEQVISV